MCTRTLFLFRCASLRHQGWVHIKLRIWRSWNKRFTPFPTHRLEKTGEPVSVCVLLIERFSEYMCDSDLCISADSVRITDTGKVSSWLTAHTHTWGADRTLKQSSLASEKQTLLNTSSHSPKLSLYFFLSYLYKSWQQLMEDMWPVLHDSDISRGGVCTLAILDWINETVPEFT